MQESESCHDVDAEHRGRFGAINGVHNPKIPYKMLSYCIDILGLNISDILRVPHECHDVIGGCICIIVFRPQNTKISFDNFSALFWIALTFRS